VSKKGWGVIKQKGGDQIRSGVEYRKEDLEIKRTGGDGTKDHGETKRGEIGQREIGGGGLTGGGLAPKRYRGKTRSGEQKRNSKEEGRRNARFPFNEKKAKRRQSRKTQGGAPSRPCKRDVGGYSGGDHLSCPEKRWVFDGPNR